MDRSDVIQLVKETNNLNEYGVVEKQETMREVFAQVDSITQSEFFQAGQYGLAPAYKFTMFEGDYDDEEIVLYNNARYVIYRTYRTKNDNIELYVEKREGRK